MPEGLIGRPDCVDRRSKFIRRQFGEEKGGRVIRCWIAFGIGESETIGTIQSADAE